MRKAIAVGILMVLAAPAQEASPAVMSAAKLPQASTAVTSPQNQMQFGPVIAPPIVAPVVSPVITNVSPTDCVAKGGVITLQGNNLLTSAGHSIAIDDGNDRVLAL